MRKMKFTFSALVSIAIITACAQEKNQVVPNNASTEKEEMAQNAQRGPHEYGGWYCPDNLGGFPPVDINKLDEISAVEGRLPTQEEAKNGTSLIYIDQEKYPEAYALDIKLPQLATIHSEHSGMDEMIIVIQAVVIDDDTIVGYRFPSGGNGSGWYDDVTFFSGEQNNGLKASPFVFEKVEIDANTKRIWQAITTTAYANKLAQRFDEEEFFTSEWTNHSMARLDYEIIGERAKGIVANVFGNLYLQIDYDLNGIRYSEKILVLENQETNTSEILLVAGPYTTDFETNQSNWQNWMAQVQAWCEEN